MKELNKKQMEILENNFNVYEDGIEAWTDGGVDMYIYIEPNKNIIEVLKEYISNFDIDEEIEIYRQDQNYKQNFTIRESLKDFEDWIEFIKDITKQLEEVQR